MGCDGAGLDLDIVARSDLSGTAQVRPSLYTLPLHMSYLVHLSMLIPSHLKGAGWTRVGGSPKVISRSVDPDFFLGKLT